MRITNKPETPNLSFRTRHEANQVLAHMSDSAAQYGEASISDLYDLVGIRTKFTDQHWGWSWSELKKASVQADNGVYRIVLPSAISLRPDIITNEGKPMTVKNKFVCSNCWNEDETEEKPFSKHTLPDGWGVVLITRNEGIATNSIVCGYCLGVIRNALAERRDRMHYENTLAPKTDNEAQRRMAEGQNILDSNPEYDLSITSDEDVDDEYVTTEEEAGEPSKDAIQATLKEMSEQEATEAEADKNAEESRQEAQDSPPIPADRDISLDAAPVQVDSPLPEVSEEEKKESDIRKAELPPTFEESKQAALEEGNLPPKRPTNNNRRRTTSGK